MLNCFSVRWLDDMQSFHCQVFVFRGHSVECKFSNGFNILFDSQSDYPYWWKGICNFVRPSSSLTT